MLTVRPPPPSVSPTIGNTFYFFLTTFPIFVGFPNLEITMLARIVPTMVKRSLLVIAVPVDRLQSNDELFVTVGNRPAKGLLASQSSFAEEKTSFCRRPVLLVG